MRRHLIFLITLYFAFTPFSLNAKNNNFCVNCVGPEQSYICNVVSKNPSADRALSFHCIVKIAKDYNHKSCSVGSVGQESCVGKKVSYVYDQGQSSANENIRILPGKEKSAGQSDQKIEEQNAKAPAKKHAKEPETLIELTDRAIEKSKKGLNTVGEKVSDTAGKIGEVTKKTGKSVSSAASEVGQKAKSAFECVLSLFKDC